MSSVIIRSNVTTQDIENVREIVKSSGFFYDYEIDVAVELVEERLEKGEPCGYLFLFAEMDGKTVGYACFGHTACTKASYDLYWIAVHEEYRHHGIGKLLMVEFEKEIQRIGGKNIYIETSSTEKYIPTQKFYERCNYILEAHLKDFYNDGDGKLIFVKHL